MGKGKRNGNGRSSEKSSENVFRLMVMFDRDTRKIDIEGPWNDGVVFLGMLEMAKGAFHEGRMAKRTEAAAKAVSTSRLVLPS